MRGLIRLGAAAALALLGGCRDLGVRGAANVPLAIARSRPPVFWSYQAVTVAGRKAYEGRTGDVFQLGDQRFIVGYPEFAGPRTLLAPVGSENGAAVYALRWDTAPYDQVFVAPDPNRLQVAATVEQ